MLIKLESGFYLNIDRIEYMYEWGSTWRVHLVGGDSEQRIKITSGDRDRIIKAMGLVEEDEDEETQVTGFGGKRDD